MTEAGRTHDNSVRIAVVTNQEQLMHALFVRSICYMEGKGQTIGQAIDGNDFQATHIVTYAGDEPIGTARVRWFQDFAKVERTAFREAWRDPRIIKRTGEFIFAHAARKGYTRITTTAEPKFARLWQRLLGFRVIEGREFHRSGKDEPYLELVRDLKPPADAISMETPPQVLLRIEGAWDDATWLG